MVVHISNDEPREEGKVSTFTISGAPVSGRAQEVFYSIENYQGLDYPSATLGADYFGEAYAGSFTFVEGGPTFHKLDLNLVDDLLVEGDEKVTLKVHWFDALTSEYFESSVNSIIRDNDAPPPPPPLPTISVSDGSAPEGERVPFTLTLNAPAPAGGVSVRYDFANLGGATADGSVDYFGRRSGGTAAFAEGETSKVVSVQTFEDEEVEGDETFHIVLSNPVGATIADGAGIGTILNDDAPPPPLTPITVSVQAMNGGAIMEGGQLGFRVTLSRAFEDSSAVVEVTRVSGTATFPGDYTTGNSSGSGAVIFVPGMMSGEFYVQSVQDGTDEPDETITFAISSIVETSSSEFVASTVTATGTILNDDAPPPPPPITVSLAPINTMVTEGGKLGFRVTMSEAATSNVEIEIAVAPGGTADALDGIGGPGFVFAPGATTRDIYINILDDNRYEPNETAFFKLAPVRTTNERPVVASTNVVEFTITDNDPAPMPFTEPQDRKLSNQSNFWGFAPGKEKVATLAGNDLIQYHEGDGRDEITDFQRGADRVQLDRVFISTEHINTFAELRSLATVTSDKKSITVDFDGGDSLTLRGVTTLDAQDWAFQ
jgi:hypothetical protein